VKSVIIGTAGHIDHGKTALVRALTGIDADRLEEEKRRGITIDIGFAHVELPTPDRRDTLRLGFVDVPGHERFVRNMLAGVGGIDLVLLVIAADEGIKPQTREHFDICRMLNIRRGITVLNKADAVDEDTLAVVRMEVEDYLRGSFLDTGTSPLVAVSSLTGRGIDELKRAVAATASAALAKDSAALPRLPIDRAFTMKGFGTVVTGTLISGTIAKEDELELLPLGKRVRVRGVQVHGAAADHTIAGQRTALNLAGIELEEVQRGMTLARPAIFQASTRFDVALTLLPSSKPLKDRSRVHLHAFTSETIAEVVLIGAKEIRPGQTAYAQLRTAEPLLLLPTDRFIIRQFSPVITIGGGEVLDAAPLRQRAPAEARVAFLRELQSGQPEGILYARVSRGNSDGLAIRDAVRETGWREPDIVALANKLRNEKKLLIIDGVLVADMAFRESHEAIMAIISKVHQQNPLSPGISREELRERSGIRTSVFAALLASLADQKKVTLSGEYIASYGRGVTLKDDEAESKEQIERAFASAGLKVPALKEVLAGLKVDKTRAQKIVTLLLRERVLVKLADDLVFHRDALASLRNQLVIYKTTSPKIDVAKFKDLTGVSRKYAIPLLEYLDREHVTRRVGDERVIL
jgi:selenocysteine-specific elongation factor